MLLLEGNRWSHFRCPTSGPTLVRIGDKVEVRLADLYYNEYHIGKVQQIHGRKRKSYNVDVIIHVDGTTQEFKLSADCVQRAAPESTASTHLQFQVYDAVEAYIEVSWKPAVVLAPEESSLVGIGLSTNFKVQVPSHLVRRRMRQYRDCKARSYTVGEKVEVKRDREVYDMSWCPAIISRAVDSCTYMVESADEM